MDTYNTFSLTVFKLTSKSDRPMQGRSATPLSFYSSFSHPQSPVTSPFLSGVPRDIFLWNSFLVWIIPVPLTSWPICVSKEGRVELKIVKCRDLTRQIICAAITPPLTTAPRSSLLPFLEPGMGRRADRESLGSTRVWPSARFMIRFNMNQ